MQILINLWRVILLMLVLLPASVCHGQEPDTSAAEQSLPYGDQHFRDLAGKLRCPTCTGLSVLDSDASFSVQIKTQVLDLMKQGKSDKEIIDFFTERYGPWILREPPKSGFSVIAWAIPIAFLVLGPILIWAIAWRRKQTVPSFGVRSVEAIATEMQSDLARLRSSRGVN